MSASGLSAPHRVHARDRARDSALLALRHAPNIHYTQSAQRWEGIDHHLLSREGRYPKHADCSSFATWCLWNGMFIPYHHSDTVNGAHWRAGFTGTLLTHGKRVHDLHNVLRGDVVLYGGGVGHHVAIVVGWRNGVPMVVSHGSEAGPFFLPFNYRSDVREIRRYI